MFTKKEFFKRCQGTAQRELRDENTALALCAEALASSYKLPAIGDNLRVLCVLCVSKNILMITKG